MENQSLWLVVSRDEREWLCVHRVENSEADAESWRVNLQRNANSELWVRELDRNDLADALNNSELRLQSL